MSGLYCNVDKMSKQVKSEQSKIKEQYFHKEEN